MPGEINLLGFSSDILSLVLETLKALDYSGTIRVIKNMEVSEEGAYNPGLGLQIVHIEEIIPPLKDVFFSVARPNAKKGVLTDFSKRLSVKQEDFLTIIHPFSNVASTAVIGKGCYLEPGVIVSPFANLGFGVTINRNASIGHHASIGDFATVNPGVHIAGHCQIGEGVSVGMGAIIFDHLSVGAGSVIGGGSIVTKDIPAGVLAYGNPCRVVKELK